MQPLSRKDNKFTRLFNFGPFFKDGQYLWNLDVHSRFKPHHAMIGFWCNYDAIGNS